MIMILTIDTTALDADSSESYASWRGDKIDIQLDGQPLKDCMYCNVDKGIAICLKRDLSGYVTIAGGDIVYEIRVGTVTVTPIPKNKGGSYTPKPIAGKRPSPPGKE